MDHLTGPERVTPTRDGGGPASESVSLEVPESVVASESAVAVVAVSALEDAADTEDAVDAPDPQYLDDAPRRCSAEAADCPVKIAAPMPRATARPPTRPTCRPADKDHSARARGEMSQRLRPAGAAHGNLNVIRSSTSRCNALRAHPAALTDEDVHEFSAFLDSLNVFNSFIIGV